MQNGEKIPAEERESQRDLCSVIVGTYKISQVLLRYGSGMQSVRHTNTNLSHVDSPVLGGQQQSKTKSAKCCNGQLQIT